MSSNFYYVEIAVSGDAADITRFAHGALSASGVDFNHFRPMPPELDFGNTNLVDTGFHALHGAWQQVARQWMLKAAAEERGYPFPMENREQVLTCLRSLDCADAYVVPGERFHRNLQTTGHGSRESWREEYWGSVQGPEHARFMQQPHAIGIWFLIDRIPAKLFKAMSAMYPDLTFTIRHTDDYRRHGATTVWQKGRQASKVALSADEKKALFEEWTRRHKEVG